MRAVFIALVVLFAVMNMAEGRVSYSGYKVIDVVIRNERERDFLKSLPEDRGDVRGIDVWTNQGVLVADGHTVNRVMLSPAGYKEVVKSGLFGHAVVTIPDVEKSIAQASIPDASPMNKRNIRDDVYDPKDDWYYHWHSYDEMQNRLQLLAKSYPNTISYSTIGESHEGRKIGMLHIKGRNPTRRIALIANTHAREWIANGVLLWTLGCITELYGHEENVTSIIDDLDLYMCPCYNPDGYTYTREVDHLWRKNRRDNGDGTFGVDQNRNWDVDWGNHCVNDTSDLTYCGPSALSEPEVLAMHDFLKSIPNWSAVVDFHSPMGGFFRPFSYVNETTPDEDKLKNVGYQFIKTVYSVHGTVYKNRRFAQEYVYSGGCCDAAYLLGAHYAYSLELLGLGFTLPESEIQKQGEEIFAGLRYFLSVAK